VDNIVFDDQGRLYASTELGNGQGAVVVVSEGKKATIIEDLDRADGLALFSDKLYVTEENKGGRVLEFNLLGKHITEVAVLQKPEGILRLSDGSFLITEDTHSGRIVRVSPEGAVTTIFKDLDRPEGLAINKLGEIFVAETGSGRVLKISALGLDDERISTEISGITNPDQISVSPDGSIWITEDIKNGRLLKYADGRLTTIVSGLDRPQGIAFAPDGTVFVAEQGKNQILRFKKSR